MYSGNDYLHYFYYALPGSGCYSRMPINMHATHHMPYTHADTYTYQRDLCTIYLHYQTLNSFFIVHILHLNGDFGSMKKLSTNKLLFEIDAVMWRRRRCRRCQLLLFLQMEKDQKERERENE